MAAMKCLMSRCSVLSVRYFKGKEKGIMKNRTANSIISSSIICSSSRRWSISDAIKIEYAFPQTVILSA